MLQKLSNNKVLFVIEIILILFGLVLSVVGVCGSVGGDGVPGKQGRPSNPEENEILASIELEASDEPGEFNAEMAGEMTAGVNDLLTFYIGYIAPFLVYILLAVYVLLEYRKPHGNLFRFTMLFYALMLVIYSVAQGNMIGCQYVLPCTAVIVSYLSGRLNKIKKNIWWIAVVTLLLLGSGLLRALVPGPKFGLLQFSSYFGALLQWIALVLAYISRFEQHKEAGAQ